MTLSINQLHRILDTLNMVQSELDEEQSHDETTLRRYIETSQGIVVEAIRQAEHPSLADPRRVHIPEVVAKLKERASVTPISGGPATVQLYDYERKQIVYAIMMLVAALKPFAAIRTSTRYPDECEAVVNVTATREIAEAWVLEWDQRAAAGNPPPWKRPDIERGMNFPIETLSIDGINVGDIRYAAGVLLSFTPVTD